MSTDTPNIAKLLDLATRLRGLLADPHPGYITWHEGVRQLATEIGTFQGMVVSRPEREAALTNLADEWESMPERDYTPLYFASKLRHVLAMDR